LSLGNLRFVDSADGLLWVVGVYFDDLPKESLVDVSEDLDWDVVELVENGPLGGVVETV